MTRPLLMVTLVLSVFLISCGGSTTAGSGGSGSRDDQADVLARQACEPLRPFLRRDAPITSADVTIMKASHDKALSAAKLSSRWDGLGDALGAMAQKALLVSRTEAENEVVRQSFRDELNTATIPATGACEKALAE